MASSDARITAREVIDAVVAAEAESDEPLIASTSCQTDDSFLTDVSDLREQLDAVRKDLGVSAAACDNFQNKLRFELPRALESLKEQYRARQRKLVEEHKIELDRRSRQQQAAAEVLVKNRELEVRSDVRAPSSDRPSDGRWVGRTNVGRSSWKYPLLLALALHPTSSTFCQ